jgi:predicted nucleic acid-binding protein
VVVLLVDADILIDVQRGHPPAVAWFGSLPDLPSVPGMVVMELIQDAQNAGQVRDALRLVAPLPRVWPTHADAERALTQFVGLHLSHRLGLLDALIAATAIGLGATLCTFNVKHYRAVPGLVTIQPYTK